VQAGRVLHVAARSSTQQQGSSMNAARKNALYVVAVVSILRRPPQRQHLHV
jgi:hypothetical protein